MAGAGGTCKFFLQGNCKFGDRCWHPHSKGGQQHQYGSSPGFTQNRYSLVNKSNTQPSPAASSTSLNETIKNITAEMEIWGTSKMWPFSCYAHSKESMCMPGFDDFSPDEMRLEAYNENRNPAAQVNYKAKEAQLGMAYKLKREKLKNPTGSTKQDLIKFIEEAKKGAMESSSSATKGQLFSTNSAFGNTATATTGSSVFGGSKTASAFGAAKPTSAFGTSSSSNLFGKGPSGANATSSSAFSFSAAATGATTQSSAFGASSTQSTLFKPATFGAASAFGGSPTTQTSAFGGSMATQPATLGAGTFGKTGPSSVFGAASGFGAQMPTAGFGAAASSPAPGFGTTASTSTFGASPPPTSSFGNSATPSAGFGSAANQTSTSVFGAMSTNQTSAFGATAASQPSAFGGTATQTSTFGGAATANQGFGATSSTFGGQPTGLFGKPASGGLFGKPVQESAATASGSTHISQQIYTALDQITLEEKAEFEAPKFTLGSIPTRPPPKEYV